MIKRGLTTWLKIITILAITMGLTGCFKSLSLSDLSTGAGAVGAVAVVDAVAPGLGTIPKVIITSLGATAGAAVVDETVQAVTKETLASVTNPWQGIVLAFESLLNHAFEIVIAICIGVIGLPMLLSFFIGKVIPRGREKDTMAENELLKKLMMERHNEKERS